MPHWRHPDVSGVGSGIAAYIDEFLETGQIYEIIKYQEMSKSRTQEPSTKEEDSTTSSTTTLQINRAPVLALWVTVVAEQEGFHRDEALTYGQWVSGTLARSKGKSLGIYQEGEKTHRVSKKPYEKVKDDSTHVVKAFGRMKIPIVCKNGQRLAVQGRKVIDPVYVQDYLERSFGDQLDSVQVCMRMLASSLSAEDLQMRCYQLYEEFRPAWKGWGQKSTLDLSKIRDLFAGNG